MEVESSRGSGASDVGGEGEAGREDDGEAVAGVEMVDSVDSTDRVERAPPPPPPEVF